MQIIEAAKAIKGEIGPILNYQDWEPNCTSNGSATNLVEAKAMLINAVKKLNQIIEREENQKEV